MSEMKSNRDHIDVEFVLMIVVHLHGHDAERLTMIVILIVSFFHLFACLLVLCGKTLEEHGHGEICLFLALLFDPGKEKFELIVFIDQTNA